MTEPHNHQRDTEAMILQAAEQEFLEKGYSGAKTTAISTLQNEIDLKAAKGECNQVDARMLMLDIVSLNLFPFIAAPLISSSFGKLFEGRDEFLEMRKKENVRTVLGKLGL